MFFRLTLLFFSVLALPLMANAITGKYASTTPGCSAFAGYSYERLYIHPDQRNPRLLVLQFYGPDKAHIELIRMGEGVTNNPFSMNQNDKIIYATQIGSNRLMSQIIYAREDGTPLWQEHLALELSQHGELVMNFRSSERGGYAFVCRYRRT